MFIGVANITYKKAPSVDDEEADPSCGGIEVCGCGGKRTPALREQEEAKPELWGGMRTSRPSPARSTAANAFS